LANALDYILDFEGSNVVLQKLQALMHFIVSRGAIIEGNPGTGKGLMLFTWGWLQNCTANQVLYL
jgi:hypothetical protein